jgi:hypothetical protein
MNESFVKRTRIEAPAEEVFRWHARPGAFERLAPPWERMEILERSGGIEPGGRVVLRSSAGRWVAEHVDLDPGRSFRDVQRRGPFRRWEHLHRFEPGPDGGSELEDRIDYELPLGALGRAVAGAAVRRRIERVFAWRHRVTAEDLRVHRGAPPRRIAVTGAGGLIGSALVPFLTAGGHDVVAVPRARRGEPASYEGADAVIHLAGEPIARRWSPEVKARIRESRTAGTRAVARALAALPRPPAVLVCASAVGVYGDRGDEELDETSRPGTGYLAEVSRDWEAAAEPAREARLRVVSARLGVVLTPKGGALARLLGPFRAGLGGRVGPGSQWMSWVSIEDAVGALHHALVDERLRGPVNVTAPEPATNADFARALGRALGRPAVLPLPAFAARLAFGELADALLLSGARVRPRRLLEAGYRFRHPSLAPCLSMLLGKEAP